MTGNSEKDITNNFLSSILFSNAATCIYKREMRICESKRISAAGSNKLQFCYVALDVWRKKLVDSIADFQTDSGQNCCFFDGVVVVSWSTSFFAAMGDTQLFSFIDFWLRILSSVTQSCLRTEEGELERFDLGWIGCQDFKINKLYSLFFVSNKRANHRSKQIQSVNKFS